jgi:hypothetical protein
MLTFKEHGYILSKFKGLISFFKEKIKSLFSNLKFGDKKSIRIDLSAMSNDYLSEDVDTKSRLGYYSEYTTAYNLAVILEKNGANLTTDRSQPSYLKKLMLDKKKELIKIDAPANEIERMESAGVVMAKSIFEDIRLNGNDYNALQFDIQLTGDSEKGASKSDLILTVGKMTKREVVDKINASLKAYVDPNINLSNSTFVSFIKTLFYDNLKTKNTEEFIEKFAKDYGSSEDLRKLYSLQNIIGTKISKGSTKESARKYAKTTHGEVIELMVKIFNTHYKKHKSEINSRMLKMLGFDSDEDFYAAIGKVNKQKTISSRKSEEMRNMFEELRKGFTLVMERNGTTNNANIYFKSLDGTTILNQANITFADTGGAKPQGKTNAFVNLRKFVR